MFQTGHKVFERWAWYTMASGLRSVRTFAGDSRLMDRWQQPGDITDVPKMVYTSGSTLAGSGTSSRFLYDGDFMRVRDITLNYTLPRKAVEAIGAPFDPNLHEAMLEVEDAENEPGTVVQEMEKGYELNGKVVRPARVIVSKAPSEGQLPETDELNG